jgi:hypothetical protein
MQSPGKASTVRRFNAFACLSVSKRDAQDSVVVQFGINKVLKEGRA